MALCFGISFNLHKNKIKKKEMDRLLNGQIHCTQKAWAIFQEINEKFFCSLSVCEEKKEEKTNKKNKNERNAREERMQSLIKWYNKNIFIKIQSRRKKQEKQKRRGLWIYKYIEWQKNKRAKKNSRKNYKKKKQTEYKVQN